MAALHRLKKGTQRVIWLFLVSLIIISIVGAYIGTRGNQVPIKRLPTQPFETVSFSSMAKDKLTLTGWYFSTDSERVAVIVHGWGGNRARLLTLAEYLQRNHINVLTFDVRGGTGRNTYGQRESEDLAGAIGWLASVKEVAPEKVTVVGASMGGAAAVTYALNHPVGQLVLISPVIDIAQVKYQVLRERHFILPQLYASGATFIERLFYGVKPINPIDHFHEVTVPTLILHGEDDKLSPTKTAKKLQQQVESRQQADIHFVFVPNGTHNFFDDDKNNNFFYSQEIVTFINSN